MYDGNHQTLGQYSTNSVKPDAGYKIIVNNPPTGAALWARGVAGGDNSGGGLF